MKSRSINRVFIALVAVGGFLLFYLGRADAQQTGVSVAVCVPDGTCAAAPPAICPGGVPNQPCQMCSAPKARDRCAFAIDFCAWNQWLGTASDCGTQWIGNCLGPGLACLQPPFPTGTCSRLTCSSGGGGGGDNS